jgi:DNA-binding IclR family transcriptional regulator
LSILEAVGQSPEPVALKDLTTLLGIDRSNVFRLANTLRQRATTTSVSWLKKPVRRRTSA